MVTVKLFGLLRLDTGVRELRVEAATLKELYPRTLAALKEQNPACPLTEERLRDCLAAVNGEPARSPRTKLRDGDTVSLFPPVAGG